MNTIKRKKADPSSIVEISFNDVIQKTGVAENTTSPIWNESFLMFVFIFIGIFISYSFTDIFRLSDRVLNSHRIMPLSSKSKLMVLVLAKLK